VVRSSVGLLNYFCKQFLTYVCHFRYIINDLNVNSAIACPDDDEVLTISGQVLEQAYTIKGYAYAGGGRRVTRVEVSFDDGCTWSLAGISYPEDLFRAVVHSDSTYGTIDLTDSDTCFCWCFWSYEASYELLNKSAAVMVRCMDESLALQPRDMYWNATGMMNNW
jgi:nitrate reductase (NAD(P)H)